MPKIWSAAIRERQAILSDEDSLVHTNKSLSLKKDDVCNGSDKNNKKGMVLPFISHSITFENIKYYVDMPSVST